ncbi:MAG: hypothetical protein U0350_02210 [Caldilineaceae bacterium]
MKIPLDALIPQEKLTQYLLAPKEVDDKSKFLAQAGFVRENPDALVTAIRELIQRENAVHDLTNVYGDYYRVEGELVGPKGRLLVVTIWIVKVHSDGKFRFVTLKPKR